MADLSVRQAPDAGALSAEHYQSYEMAKANDSILGGDDIAQIRSYAAFARAQAQAIHKSIATMGELDDVAQAKAEMNDTAQTFAKVSIYADTRIGEILRELPKNKGGRPKNSPSMAGEFSKRQAYKDAGIGRSTAEELQLMAANPDVVEAVIAKAEAEGRIVARKQVTDEIKRIKAEKEQAERDKRQAEADRAMAERERDEAIRALESQPMPEPEVREVAPADYEETKRRNESLTSENKRLLNENGKLRDSNLEKDRQIEERDRQLGERQRNNGVNRDVEQLVNNVYTFLNRHGGKSRAFDQFYRVDETMQRECRKALVALDGFAQSLLAMIGETNSLGE